jgi:hypothetical protein
LWSLARVLLKLKIREVCVISLDIDLHICDAIAVNIDLDHCEVGILVE